MIDERIIDHCVDLHNDTALYFLIQDCLQEVHRTFDNDPEDITRMRLSNQDSNYSGDFKIVALYNNNPKALPIAHSN